MRSRSAAGLLQNQGFQAISLEGGILAWHGLVSRAAVDQGMYLLEGRETPEEALALAYGLEEGARRFYQELASEAGEAAVSSLFAALAEAEVRHEDRLWGAYRRRAGAEPNRETFERTVVVPAVEGGLSADQVLARWGGVPGDPEEAIELAMALETDSLDLYLRMAGQMTEDARSVFLDLASEERAHLARLGEQLGRRAAGGPSA
ncbi:MAG: hypothetical protein Kow0092_38480 [Deferrisomatales bacterium]